MNPGIFYALAAYLWWGLLPLYLHAVAAIAPFEVLAHRILWALVLMLLVLALLRRPYGFGAALRKPAVLGRFALSAFFVSINWLVYIWAIGAGHTVDASLGYFINPLVNVLVGALLLHERLRLGQKLPLVLAFAGVAWLTVQTGGPPWIGIVLAISFSLYGLLRRQAPLGAMEGFALETLLLAPFALAFLAWQAHLGALAFANGSNSVRWLLVAAGPLTAVPLVLFTAGARRISFSLLGILQYLAPSLQWLVGIYVFHEDFDHHKALGFGLIWLALLVFALEGAWFGWQRARAAPPAA